MRATHFAKLWTFVVAVLVLFGLSGAAHSQERKVITYASWELPSEELKADVEVQFPHIELEQLTFGSESEMNERIITMAIGGTIPDIWVSNPDTAAHFYAAGITADLTPFMERDADFDIDDYFPAAVADYRQGGVQVGFPSHFQLTGVWYNKDLFDAAGLVYPGGDWTWSDYREMARRLTIRRSGELEPEQWGTIHPMGTQFWMPWIFSAGGSIVDNLENPTRSMVQSFETLSGIEFLRTLMVEDQVTGPVEGPGGGGMFFDGRAGMYPYYAVAARVSSLGQDFRYNVANIPAGPAGAVNAILPGGYVVGNTENAEDAWQIVKWISETGRNSTNTIPSYIPFAQTDLWPDVDPPVPADYNRAAWIEGALGAQPQVINHPRVYDIVQEVGRFGQAIEGNVDVRAVAESIAQVINGYLSE